MSEASSLLVAQDRESSKQRKEAVSLRERLAIVVREQDRLDRKSAEAETVITEKRTSSSSSQEVTGMKSKKVILAECLMQQEQQEQKLHGNLVSKEVVLTSLNEEVLAYERRLGDKDQELARLRQKVQESQGVNEKSETLDKVTREENNHLSKQLACVHLARDALEDEAGHLREEVAKLRGQQEVAQLHVANITQGIDQLVARLATREREVADLRLRAKSLEGEVEKRLEGVVEDWRLKTEGEKGKARELQKALLLRQGELEGLEGQVLTLKSRLVESRRNMSEQQEQARSESTLGKARILELSLLTDNLRKELVVEKREAKERLGKVVATSSELVQAELAKLRNRLEEEVVQQKTTRDSLTLEVARLKGEKERTLLQDRSQATDKVDHLMEENRGLRSRVTELDLELKVLRRRKDTDDMVKELRNQELKRQLQEAKVQVLRLQKEVEEVRREAGQELEASEGHIQELHPSALSISSGPLVEKGEEATLVIVGQDQSQVSTSTTTSTAKASQCSRASTPPSASSTISLHPSHKRSVDLDAHSNYQKKACVISTEGMCVQVSSSVTEQSESSIEVESDMSVEVEGGEEREQVGSSNQYSRGVEVEALSCEQEENSSGAAADSSPLQTLEHVCDGCQSVFTRAASLHHHQAVAGRCKRVKELEPQEFACHRCSRQFTSKSPWNRHISQVLNCASQKKQREDKTVEEAGSMEVQGAEEELCLETGAMVESSLEVLPAGSPQSLPGLEVTAAPVAVSPESDHCYALSGSQAPEHRPSSHSSGQPVQVNSGPCPAQLFNSCQFDETKIHGSGKVSPKKV